MEFQKHSRSYCFSVTTSFARYLLMARVETVLQLLLARATLGFLSGAAAVEVAFVADLTSKSDRADWVAWLGTK